MRGVCLPTAVDEAFRQLATLDAASLQAAIAPIVSATASMRGSCGSASQAEGTGRR